MATQTNTAMPSLDEFRSRLKRHGLFVNGPATAEIYALSDPVPPHADLPI